MTYDEAIHALEGLVGQTVEVGYSVVVGENQILIGGTGGQVTKFAEAQHHAQPSGRVHRLHLDAPWEPHVSINEHVWQSGDFTADRYEEDIDDPDESSPTPTWTIHLQQAGVLTTITAYGVMS